MFWSLFLTLRNRQVFRHFLRFGLVGALATVIHLVVALLLVSRVQNLNILYANITAFVVASIFSFAGNYYWVFKSSKNIISSVCRFFAIAGAAFAFNMGVLVWLVAIEGVTSFAAIVLSAAVIPFITFLINRLWVF